MSGPAPTAPRGPIRTARPPSPWTLPAGSLLGIPIRVHATFALLVAWVATVSSGDGEGVVSGVVFLFLLFACVVLHELGHALAARRYGIETREIVLYPIGGVARLDTIPVGWPEFWVALAGPAVNLVLALLLTGGIFLFEVELPSTAEELVAKGSLVWQLLAANLSLLVFNLIPAFPMDGGRVLRALMSVRMGQERATKIAARVGQALALGLGLVALLVQPFNPVLLLIAFFVFTGAGQEAAHERGRAAIRGLEARRAMVTKFETLAPQDTLERAAGLLIATHQHDFPVVDAWGRVAGVLHRARLLEALAAGDRDQPVFDVMERDVFVVPPEMPLEELFNQIQSRARLPVMVVGANGLEGMITLDNFVELIEIARAVGPHG